MLRHDLIKPPIGRIRKVSLREAWLSESGDFTPWLAQADNISILAEALNLDLEVEAQERNVGPFRADILCKNTADNTWVLVENQLERTDHVHLGQLLTYASGLEAVTIVWIAQRFTEEHRATLDWLNEITNNSFNFFGVEIELFQIGDSPVAPYFNIVSKPNDWSKTVSGAASQLQHEGITPTKQLQLRFWTTLRENAEKRGSFLRFQKPSPQQWTSLPIGRANFHMDATCSPQVGEVSVQLVIQTDFPKSDFRQLLAQKDQIEAEAGERFDWKELPDRIQSRVDLRKPADPEDENTWPQLFDWIIGKLELMHRVFGGRIKALKLAESAEAQAIDGATA